MGALQRDGDETAKTLARWFSSVGGLDKVEIDGVVIPAATGWSNETILFDGRWVREGQAEQQRLVARIAPSTYQVFPESTFVRQYEVMRAVAAQGVVPMPAVVAIEPDDTWFGQPFWIMERVDGQIATDAPPYAAAGWLRDAAGDEQERAWCSGIDAMAALHSIDIGRLDLPAGTFPRSTDPLGALLDHHDRFLRWAEDGTPHALARRVLQRLRATRPPDPVEGAALSWGDARLGNVIYRDFEVAAVLDWEMTAIGDPLLDLGWWLFADEALTAGAGVPRLPGFLSAEATATRWSGATGRSTGALDWFLLFAGLRFTVIMLRMGKLLAEMGLVPPAFAYDNLISQALDRRFDP